MINPNNESNFSSIEQQNISDNEIINNKTNIKIKYKLKKSSLNEFDKDINNTILMTEIKCSHDFLINRFGKSIRTINNLKIKDEWYVKVNTSNYKIYYIIILNEYQKNEENIETENTKDIKTWNIIGNHHEFLDYTKLVKLFNFEFNNFIKKEEKKKLKELKNVVSKKKNTLIDNNRSHENNILIKNNRLNDNNRVINTNELRYIDETKYNIIDKEQLTNLTDIDLASILFIRFKNSNNFLVKEALIIQRALLDPTNYNKKSNNYEKSNYNQKYNKSNNENHNRIIVNKENQYKNNKIIVLKKRDKSKYNNKKNIER